MVDCGVLPMRCWPWPIEEITAMVEACLSWHAQHAMKPRAYAGTCSSSELNR